MTVTENAENRMTKILAAAAVIVFMLAGCGAETASTAAAAAQLKAREAEQAKQQLEAAQKEIDAAQQLMQQRLENADRNAAAATAPQ